MHNLRVLFLVAAAASGCATAVGEVRTGPFHAARPDDCALELATVGAEDMAPGARFGPGGELETVGTVMLGAAEGTDALSPEIKQLVRPRACAMGGEVLSLLASGTGANRRGYGQQDIVFQVWAKRSTTPAKPQAF